MNPDALVELIERGDVAGVEAAVRADPGVVHHQITSKDQPLHIACWQKQLAISGILLGYGADVSAAGDNGRTPLNYAVQEGDAHSIPIVAALLRLGADPMARDRAKRTVEERAKIELDEGLANVLELIPRRGQPAGPARGALGPLVAAGDFVAVADALKHGTATATVDALHVACARGDLAITAVLLGYGAEVTQPDAQGNTALHAAVNAGTFDSLPLVALLLAAGANPDARDGAGGTVDDLARSRISDGLDGVLDLLRRHRP
jgi:hypothetical protein